MILKFYSLIIRAQHSIYNETLQHSFSTKGKTTDIQLLWQINYYYPKSQIENLAFLFVLSFYKLCNKNKKIINLSTIPGIQ